MRTIWLHLCYFNHVKDFIAGHNKQTNLTQIKRHNIVSSKNISVVTKNRSGSKYFTDNLLKFANAPNDVNSDLTPARWRAARRDPRCARIFLSHLLILFNKRHNLFHQKTFVLLRKYFTKNLLKFANALMT